MSEGSTVAVFGDIHGHVLELVEGLTCLGFNFDLGGRLPTGQDWSRIEFEAPAGLHVISAGDLVHRGPDSDGVIRIVDNLINAGVWTQVAGNHEQVHVGRPMFGGYNNELSYDEEEILRRWWHDGKMLGAAGIITNDDEYVVTHAGVTAGFWSKYLGHPVGAAATVNAINDIRHAREFLKPGMVLTGEIDIAAGPLWAESGRENAFSWGLMPDLDPGFSQVHGHSSAYEWSTGRWWNDANHVFNEMGTVEYELDYDRSCITLTVGVRKIIGIDPGHGRRPNPRWAPWVVEGEPLPGPGH